MQKIVLNQNKYLSKYKELLLILTKKSNNEIINSTHISEYDINKMINNYEFTNGSYELERESDGKLYNIAISIKDQRTIYVTCDNKSKGYLFR